MIARSRFAAAAALACFAAGAIAQGQFIQSPPLAQTVTTPVGAVAPGPTQVPIITWGGDIATVLANGNAKATSKTSIFGKLGLNLRLAREDVFAKQLEAYLSGRSPYLRGTLGMLNMATEAANRDPRTKPIVIYQLTWSAGGDALVVKGSIKTTKDLRGKTVAVQAYGPHVDYLSKILADSGLTPKDVTIRWTSDLTGSAKSPAAALHNPAVDAALVIIPDALALTSSGTVGTGAEDSVKGARILLSTKTANRIIADVYAVRSDFFESNRAEVEKFVQGLVQGEDALRKLVANKQARAAEFKDAMSAAARELLDSPQAISDTEGMYKDADFAGVAGNAAFFGKADNPRSFAALNKEIQGAFSALGLMAKAAPLEHAGWDYRKLGAGADVVAAETRRFDAEKVATMVARKQSQGKLQEGELFSFEVFFKPNQDKFTADLYGDAFKKVASLAATYGGAIITVEGHSDPMAYLRAKRDGSPDVVLGRTQQSAKNLSLSRAIAVRDSLIAYAKSQGVSLDPTQFAVVGHGITQPKTGICGSDPCAPKSETEWQSNMRVEFRIIQVEAEASAFKPL
ncbi:MAG TPA: ABC transporter substrate-binding protein [Burkholderiales bacterium]|nr:ABC transporter substrate-binding protein [Burkholderiales bacterium]